MSLKRIALLVALITVPGTDAFAQASNYYEVPDAITNSQDLDGVAAANPGVYDGAHFDVDTYGADQGGGVLQMELRMYRDADWEDPILFDDFYEDFLATGLAGETDILKLMSQDRLDETGCNVRTLRLKNLRLEEAVAIVNNDIIADPSGFGCIAPLNFWVSGTASEPGLITFDDGGLVLNRRDLLTFFGLTLHARTGDNFLESPGDIGGQPLQIRVDPSSSLQIRAGSGTTRIRAAQNVAVDNGEFSIVSGPAAADANLIWGEPSRPGQDLVLKNGSVFRVGDSATTLRVGFEFVPGEGVQVDGSTLDVTSFATLSSPLVLRSGLAEIAANGHLVASRVHSTGSSTLRADTAALDTSIDRLEVPGGLLILDGGEFVLAGDNPPIVGTLQLGTLMGGPEIFVPDTSIVSNPIVPDRELSFDSGGRLTGQGSIEMSEAHHAVAINDGATLAPGLSIGSLNLVGQLFMEDGASVEMEVDTGMLLGGGQIASDTVDLGSPYGDLWLGLGGGTQLQLSILNDTALPEGSRARLFSYPLPDRWNGETFAGFPNGAVFEQGANLWQIRYDDPLVPGLEDIIPTRLVSLTVVAPHLQVLPSRLISTGAAPVGQPAAPVTVTLRNAGVVPIDINTLAAILLDGGGANTDFAFLNDNCTGMTLLANETCTFDVQMTASQPGTDVAVFEVNGADEGRFYGEGVPSGGSVTLDPPIRDFGDLAVLDTSEQVFTLTNGSAIDLTALTLVVHQLATADYTLQDDNCTGSLAAGASCTFKILFEPASTGVITGVVDVQENGVTVVQAAVLGRGFDTSLDATPDPLAFGDQEVGTSSAPQAVTISNTGSRDLVVSAVNTSSGDYTISGDNCTGVTIATGNSCVLQVVFTPSQPGDDPAGLSIVSNAVGSPHTISITGRGLAAAYTLDRPSIEFGEQQVGVTSAPVRVTLTSTGNEALQVTALTSTNAEFAIVAETCTAQSIPVGQTCYFEVVATVATEHRANGAIMISSNGWSSPDTVQLSATGNTAPTPDDGFGETGEDIPYSGTLTATDPDLPPQPLTYSIDTDGTKGTAVMGDPTAGTFTYTPNPGAIGSDSFTFIVNDGIDDSQPGTFTIEIRPNLEFGDLIVSDAGAAALILVDPSSGQQAVLSQGGSLVEPHGVTARANGMLLVADGGGTPGSGAVVQVDPVDGTQTVFTGGLEFPIDVAVDDTGAIYVSNGDAGINKYSTTGTLLDVFSGGDLDFATGLDVVGTDLYVASAGASVGQSNKLVHIDLGTGAQSLISTDGLLTFPMGIEHNPAESPFSLMYIANDRPLAGSAIDSDVITIDTVGGTEAVFSSGPLVTSAIDVTFTLPGNGYAVNSDGSVIALNLLPGGDPTLISSDGHFGQPFAIEAINTYSSVCKLGPLVIEDKVFDSAAVELASEDSIIVRGAEVSASAYVTLRAPTHSFEAGYRFVVTEPASFRIVTEAVNCADLADARSRIPTFPGTTEVAGGNK